MPQHDSPAANATIPLTTARNLYGLFRERVRLTPDELAYRQFERAAGQWVEYRWSQVADLAARMQAALHSDGLRSGDRVAVMLRNSVEWVAFDQAALGLGLVLVPLYTNDRPDNIAYCLADAGVKLLLLEGGRAWRELRDAVGGVDSLAQVVLLGGDEPDRPGQRSLRSWLAPYPTAALTEVDASAPPDGLASIVYTSGTTGRPKGVMLSHYNMLWDAEAATRVLTPTMADLFLSFLPLSHTLERTAGLYVPMFSGTGVAFARSVGQLAEDFLTQKPTILISVPRIFELTFAKIHDQVQRRTGLTRQLFRLALQVGWRAFEYRNGRCGWHPALLLHPLLQKKVGDPLLRRFGGRMRVCISGGAALSPEVSRLFLALGMPIIQGYGLTEHSPVISVNTIEHNDPRSVGPALPGVEVDLADGDELVARSPAVMQGYWHNPTATAEMIDAQGWLHTGDRARIDDGVITITGRIKEILVLSNGEKVPPNDMELAIAVDPLFEQVLVVGEGRPNLAAVIVLNPDKWRALAAKLGLDPDAPASLRSPDLKRRLRKQVALHTKAFPGYAQVRDTVLTLDPWTVDNGLLTATLKTRRKRVLERYRHEVDELYQRR